MSKSLFVLCFILLSGCANYRLTNTSNPFEQYGIKSLHIPMFYNHSSLPNVSNVFTTNIINTLTGFEDLKLGKSASEADAVLIGIVLSEKKLNDVDEPIGKRSVKNTYKDALGANRDDFNLPTSSHLKLNLRIIVIKRPSLAELKFLQTKYGQHASSNKIIFNEVITTSSTYLLKELDEKGLNVLGTQNRGTRKFAISNLATQAASSFKDIILYAF